MSSSKVHSVFCDIVDRRKNRDRGDAVRWAHQKKTSIVSVCCVCCVCLVDASVLTIYVPKKHNTTMIDIFRSLKHIVNVSSVRTDSPVFRLHYSVTVMILMSFSLIITTRQYVGNPIDCVHTKDIPEDVLNTYCWIHSTYTLKSLFLKKVGSEVPYPGVGNSEGKSGDRKYYRYYQWVCFVLFFQVGD